MSIFLAILYATLVIYLRTKLLPEYYHFTSKGYLKQQKKQKILQQLKKTDVTLFFTKSAQLKFSIPSSLESQIGRASCRERVSSPV